jgi:hypothetical protein
MIGNVVSVLATTVILVFNYILTNVKEKLKRFMSNQLNQMLYVLLVPLSKIGLKPEEYPSRLSLI